MALPDIFEVSTTAELISRLDHLKPDSPAQWGRMDVAQMLAHCCIPYAQIQGQVGGGPWALRWLARLVLKGSVVGEAPFRRNLPTARTFIVSNPRDFEGERDRLRGHIQEIHGQGADAVEGRPHAAYGPLTARQWSNLLFKHLDHHLRQFGV